MVVVVVVLSFSGCRKREKREEEHREGKRPGRRGYIVESFSGLENQSTGPRNAIVQKVNAAEPIVPGLADNVNQAVRAGPATQSSSEPLRLRVFSPEPPQNFRFALASILVVSIFLSFSFFFFYLTTPEENVASPPQLVTKSWFSLFGPGTRPPRQKEEQKKKLPTSRRTTTRDSRRTQDEVRIPS